MIFVLVGFVVGCACGYAVALHVNVKQWAYWFALDDVRECIRGEIRQEMREESCPREHGAGEAPNDCVCQMNGSVE